MFQINNKALCPLEAIEPIAILKKAMEIKKVYRYKFRSIAIILALSLYVSIESVWTQKAIAPKVSVFTFEQNG